MRLCLLIFFMGALSFGSVVRAEPDIIYAVAPKMTPLSSRFEFALAGVYNLNNRYVGEYGLVLCGLYHLRENLALELQVNGFLRRYNSSLYEKLTSIHASDVSSAFAPVKYYRSTWLVNTLLEYSLLYGKLSFTDHYLGEMGIYTMVGIGLMGLELVDPTAKIGPKTLADSDTLPFQMTTPFGIGLRLHFANHFGIRLNLLDNVQVLWASGDSHAFYDISHRFWLQLGVAYVF